MPLPKVHVEGRLTRNPELKFLPSGAAVASLGIACNDRKKNDQTGEWEDGDTTFLNVTAWRDMAENVAESLHKGDLVFIEGKLAMRKYTNKEGQEVTTFDVTAETIGPSLRWTGATIHPKAQRGAPQQGAPVAQEDPWATTPTPPAQQPVAPNQQPAAAPQAQPQGGGWTRQYDEPPF